MAQRKIVFPSKEEKAINQLGAELVKDKLSEVEKNQTISQLGTELAKLKIDMMIMKGGA